MTVHLREQNLKQHYNTTLRYDSPLNTAGYFTELCEALDYEPDIRRVLDLGCGDGRLLAHITPGAYYGVDYSTTRLTVAAQIVAAGRPEVRFRLGDVYEHLDTTKDTYTLTVAVETLEHLEDPARVVAAAQAISDVVVATVPVDMPYHAHLQVYETESDVIDQLQPDRLVRLDRHWGLLWEQ